MATSVLGLFPSIQSGFGSGLANLGELAAMANLLFEAQAGVTAHAGGGQASATPLQGFVNEVSTVATAADSVGLPMGLPGMSVVVINDTATSVQVFGAANNPNTGAGDTIAPSGSVTQAATAVGVAQAGAKVATYFCFAPGKWKQFLTA